MFVESLTLKSSFNIENIENTRASTLLFDPLFGGGYQKFVNWVLGFFPVCIPRVANAGPVKIF
jgi:hypothetical protein